MKFSHEPRITRCPGVSQLRHGQLCLMTVFVDMNLSLSRSTIKKRITLSSAGDNPPCLANISPREQNAKLVTG